MYPKYPVQDSSIHDCSLRKSTCRQEGDTRPRTTVAVGYAVGTVRWTTEVRSEKRRGDYTVRTAGRPGNDYDKKRNKKTI